MSNSKPPMKIKSVRVFKIAAEVDYIQTKQSYTGAWDTIHVRNRKKLPTELTLKSLYQDEIEIKPQKLAFLRSLAKCLRIPENVHYYLNLQSNVAHTSTPSTSTSSGPEVEIDNEDNSSGAED